MSLIEVLLHYKYLIRRHGRKVGNDFIEAACDESLVDHIKFSVSDQGKFIDGHGKTFEVEDKR